MCVIQMCKYFKLNWTILVEILLRILEYSSIEKIYFKIAVMFSTHKDIYMKFYLYTVPGTTVELYYCRSTDISCHQGGANTIVLYYRMYSK